MGADRCVGDRDDRSLFADTCDMKIGDIVEVSGLQSPLGKNLNGSKGDVTQLLEAGIVSRYVANRDLSFIHI